MACGPDRQAGYAAGLGESIQHEGVGFRESGVKGFVSNHKVISDRDRQFAQTCLECPACKYARRSQKGLLFWFVTVIESRLCPYCRAYERVYGRKAHEPSPDDNAASSAS